MEAARLRGIDVNATTSTTNTPDNDNSYTAEPVPAAAGPSPTAGDTGGASSSDAAFERPPNAPQDLESWVSQWKGKAPWEENVAEMLPDEG